MNEQAVPVKMIIVGSINVGKTSLVTKYATGKHPLKTKSTQNCQYVEKRKKVNGIQFDIRLWDTAGQEQYKSLTKLFIKDTRIAILVYAIDDEKSFNEINDWLKLVKSINEGDIICAVVANKSDLASNNTIPDEKGKEYAKSIGAEWRLTSSKEEGINNLVDELFLKYYNSNFNLNASGSLSITLSTEVSKQEKKGCCGGGNNDTNPNTRQNSQNEPKAKDKD